MIGQQATPAAYAEAVHKVELRAMEIHDGGIRCGLCGSTNKLQHYSWCPVSVFKNGARRLAKAEKANASLRKKLKEAQGEAKEVIR